MALQTFADGVGLQESQQPIKTTHELPTAFQQLGAVVDTFSNLNRDRNSDAADRLVGEAAIQNLQFNREAATADLLDRGILTPEDAALINEGDAKGFQAVEKAARNGMNNRGMVALKRNIYTQNMMRKNPQLAIKLARASGVSLSDEKITLQTEFEREEKVKNTLYQEAVELADEFNVPIHQYDRDTAIEVMSLHPMQQAEHTISKLEQQARFDKADRAASQRKAELGSSTEMAYHYQALGNVYLDLVQEAGGDPKSVSPVQASVALNQAFTEATVAIDRRWGDWPEVATLRKQELKAEFDRQKGLVDGTAFGKQQGIEQSEFSLRVMNRLNTIRAELGIQREKQNITINDDRIIKERAETINTVAAGIPGLLKIKEKLEQATLFETDSTLRNAGLEALQGSADAYAQFLVDIKEKDGIAFINYLDEEKGKGRTQSRAITGQIALWAAGSLSPEQEVGLVDNLKVWLDNAEPGDRRDVMQAVLQAANNPTVLSKYGESPAFRQIMPYFEEEVSNQVAAELQPFLDELVREKAFGFDTGIGLVPQLWTKVNKFMTVDLDHLNKTGDIQYELREGSYKQLRGSDIRAVNQAMKKLNARIVGRFQPAMNTLREVGNHPDYASALQSVIRKQPGLADFIRPEVTDDAINTLADRMADVDDDTFSIVREALDLVVPEFVQKGLKNARDSKLKRRQDEARQVQEELSE